MDQFYESTEKNVERGSVKTSQNNSQAYSSAYMYKNTDSG